MQRILSIAFSISFLALAGQALAAEVDMSKITCKEVGAMKPGRAVAVAMWENGYAHGKAGNPVLDGDKAHANAEKIVDFCKSKPDSTLAGAMEAVAKM